MPTLLANGISQNYRIDGPDHAPNLLLCNSLGTSLHMWDDVTALLEKRFRVVRYDMRGHGETETPPGPYSLALLSNDAIALLDALGIERTHVCGISLGGMIAQWLAIHFPERVSRLILSNTAARIGSADGWKSRIESVHKHGMVEVATGTAARWFTAEFIQGQATVVTRWTERVAQGNAQGYVACCAALAEADLNASLADIVSPTLCIAGAQDGVTTPSDADSLAEGIRNAQRLNLPTSHLSPLERPRPFAAAVAGFLLRDLDARMHEEQRYSEGMRARRSVLGEAHVDRSLLEQSERTTEFQDLITRYAWGEIWTRPGLPRHTRSLLTIAMMIALNREAELRLHLNAAINNGVSRDEIKEVLLQAAIYCGVPAANSAFHLAEQVFAAQDTHSIQSDLRSHPDTM